MKHKNVKKLLSILLAVLMVMSVVPAMAFTVNAEAAGYHKIVSDDTEIVTNFDFVNAINPNATTAYFCTFDSTTQKYTYNSSTSTSVNDYTNLLEKDESAVIVIPNGFQRGSKYYDVYVKVTANIDYSSSENVSSNKPWQFKNDGGFITIRCGEYDIGDESLQLKQDFDMTFWIQNRDFEVTSFEIIAGACYVDKENERVKLWGNSDVIYSNASSVVKKNDENDLGIGDSWSTGNSSDNNSNIYIMGNGSSDNKVNAGYISYTASYNTGPEWVLGYLEDTSEETGYHQITNEDATICSDFEFVNGVNTNASNAYFCSIDSSTGLYKKTSTAVSDTLNLLKEGEEKVIVIPEGFKYGTATYDLYAKIIAKMDYTQTPNYSVTSQQKWSYKVSSTGFFTIGCGQCSLSKVVPLSSTSQDFDITFWLQEKNGNAKITDLELIAGACYINCDREGIRPYSYNDIIYSNATGNELTRKTNFGISWAPTTTTDDKSDIYILGSAASDNSVKVGYVSNYTGTGPEWVVGYLKHRHCICGATHQVVGDHTTESNITYEPWTTSTSLPASGSYYLDTDVSLSSTWTIAAGNTVNLCLNGHVINGNNSCRVITVNGVLNLTDCNPTEEHRFSANYTSIESKSLLWTLNESSGDKVIYGGIITGGDTTSNKYTYGAGINVSGSTAKFVMYGGNIAGNIAYQGGGGINVEGGATAEMKGGKIQHNALSASNGNGAGVRTDGPSIMEMTGGSVEYNSAAIAGGINVGGSKNNSRFTLDGGSVQYNYATWIGGVFVNYGTFEMKSGTIEYNTSSNSSGGGMLIRSDNAFLLGGTIRYNKTNTVGGGIYFDTTAVPTIGGSVKITDNTLLDGTTKDNVYLTSNVKINIGTGDNAPTSDMSVGVTLANTTGTFSSGVATDDYLQYFSSDNDNYRTLAVATSSTYNYNIDGYSVTENVCNNGSVSVGATKTYAKGATVTVTPSPNQGYKIKKVYWNDGEEHTINPVAGVYSFTMPTSDVTVGAEFIFPVCQIVGGPLDGTEYGTIKDAISAAGTTPTKIKLIDDINITNLDERIEVEDGYDITIDLDGFVVKSDEQYRSLHNAGTLTFKDSNTSSQKHYFVYNEHDAWDYIESPTNAQIEGSITYDEMSSSSLVSGVTIVEITGGCITGSRNQSNANYGALMLNDGVLNIDGGYFIGNSGTSTDSSGAYGGAICNRNEINMTGGGIIGNAVKSNSTTKKSNYGGGIYLQHTSNGTTFNFSDGVISYNSATSNSKSVAYGGGVFIGEDSTFKMTGGTVEENYGEEQAGGINNQYGSFYMSGGSIINNYSDSSYPSGGVYVWEGDNTILGNAVIKDNYNGTTKSNLCLSGASATYINVTDNNNVDGITKIDEDAEIGITTMVNDVVGAYRFTNGSTGSTIEESKNSLEHFTSDVEDYIVNYCLDTKLAQEYFELVLGNEVTEASCTNGSISVGDTKIFSEGTTVTITSTPSSGYALQSYTVYKSDEPTTTVTVTDGTFVMPNYPVTVTADFAEIPTELKNAKYYAYLTLNKSIDISLLIRDASINSSSINNLQVIINDSVNVPLTLNNGEIKGVIASKEVKAMGESVHVKVIYNGIVAKEFDYSVRDYCEAAISTSSNEKLVKLCYATLYYGECAQKYDNPLLTEFVTDGIDESALNEAISGFISSGIPSTDTGFTESELVTAASASLTIGSTTAIHFYITSPNKYTIDDFNIRNEDDEIVKPEQVSMTESNGVYEITISNINSSQLSKTYTVNIKNVGRDRFMISYGPSSYCKDISDSELGGDITTELKDLTNALYIYGQAAAAYSAK